MNFDFDDTQYALRDLARDLFSKESPPSRLRELWEGKPFDRRVWKTMAEAGICGLTVPEEFGGAGGNILDLTLVYEEAGRACLPEPLLETTGIAAPLIARFGSDALKSRWLPAIASGDAIAGIQEADGAYVAGVADADFIIAGRDDAIHIVEGGNFQAIPVPSLDQARPVAQVECTTGAETRLASTDDPDALLLFWGAAFTGAASILNGLAMQMRDTSVEHVTDRKQFGRPVGSFQAVKHKLASMHVAIESSRPAAWYAAYAVAANRDSAAVDSAVAKIAANDAEALSNAEALQCHGGIGFTWEHDLHFWLKRGMTLRGSFGTSRELRHNLVQIHEWDELL
jgi:alkylation response protein AidB-like acyl-CoA dehydrogenase